MLVSGMTGMFLGVLAVAGPFMMSARLIVVAGVLMSLTSALAAVAHEHAWLAVAGMVVVVFIGTVWTAIPLVGRLLGTFPAIVYLLILARGRTFTGVLRGGGCCWHRWWRSWRHCSCSWFCAGAIFADQRGN